MAIKFNETSLILHKSNKCACGEPMARSTDMDPVTGYWACINALRGSHGIKAPYPSPRVPFKIEPIEEVVKKVETIKKVAPKKVPVAKKVEKTKKAAAKPKARKKVKKSAKR